jgi:hypothetical protein
MMASARELETPRPWGERMHKPDPATGGQQTMRVPVIDGETPIAIVMSAQEVGLAWKQSLRPHEYMNLVLEKLREAVPDAVEGVFHLKLVKGHLLKQKFGMQSRDGIFRYIYMSNNYYRRMKAVAGEVK